VGRWNTRRVAARLEPGETLYASVRAVTSRRAVGGGWLRLVQGWYFFLPGGVIFLVGRLAYHPAGYTISSFGLLGAAIVLFLLAFRHTRILAFTDRNVVVMNAPMTFFPTRVVARLPTALPIAVQHGFGWETIELRGKRFTVDRQGCQILRGASLFG
jgi:hypothetical protein